MHHFFNYKNCKVHYTVEGRGSTVVLLHGFLEDSTMWEDFSAVLSKKYRVICIDLLGHGKTENLGYVHSMELQAAVVHAVIRNFKLRKIIMVGHSMGGYVSLAFAIKYKSMIKGLILMNTTALPDTPERLVNRDRAIQIVKSDSKSFVRLSIPLLFAEKNRKKYASEILKITAAAQTMSPQGIIAALEGMKIRKNATSVFRNSSFPIAMVIGIDDPGLPFEDVKRQIRNTRVVPIELFGGHMSHIENKETLILELNGFIRFCNS